MSTLPPPDAQEMMRQLAEIEQRIRYVEARLGIVYHPTAAQEAANETADNG